MLKKSVTRVGLLALFVASGLIGGVFTKDEAQARPNDDGRSGFTARDFRGDYGMLEVGEAEGLPFVEISVVHADGRGNIVIEAIGNIGGQIAVNDTLKCPYSVRPNGMGHMDCHSDLTGESTSADFVLAKDGTEVKIITTPNEHGYTYSVANRQ